MKIKQVFFSPASFFSCLILRLLRGPLEFRLKLKFLVYNFLKITIVFLFVFPVRATNALILITLRMMLLSWANIRNIRRNRVVKFINILCFLNNLE